MTVHEIASTLPNGFHDAKLRSINIDYVKRQATLWLEVWVGSMSATDDTARERYRACELILEELEFIVMEPPDVNCRNGETGDLVVDIGDIRSLKKAPSVPLPTSSGCGSLNWLFVQQWNAFIYFAARSASLGTGVRCGQLEPLPAPPTAHARG